MSRIIGDATSERKTSAVNKYYDLTALSRYWFHRNNIP